MIVNGELYLMKEIISKKDIVDFLVGMYVITTLAFHDKTLVMLMFQILAFGASIVMENRIVVSDLLKSYVIWKGLFVIFSLLSFVWALNTDTILSCVLSICQVTMCGITLILYCNTNDNIDKLVKYCIVSCVLLIIRLLVVVPINAWKEGERVGQYLGSGESGGYGNTGVTYVLSIGAVFVFFEAIRKKEKIYYIMMLLFTLFSLLSGSKKAIIIFGVMVLLTALLNNKSPRKTVMVFFGAVIVSIVGLYIVMKVDILYNSVGIRIEQMVNLFTGGKVDASTTSRITYLIQAKDIFLDKPICGVGLDGFRYFNKRLCWAENNMMELLADLGIVGFLIYYWFPVVVLIKAVVKRMQDNVDSVFLIVIMATFFVIDVTMVTYSQETIQFYFVITSIIAFKDEKRNLIKEVKNNE